MGIRFWVNSEPFLVMIVILIVARMLSDKITKRRETIFSRQPKGTNHSANEKADKNEWSAIYSKEIYSCR